MKLKYYLRGLAVGILLTTILLMITNAGNKPLTDAQIRQRARELGMIESDSIRLSALQGEGTSAPESDSSSNIMESSAPENHSENDTSGSDMPETTTQSSEREDNQTEAPSQQETTLEPVIFQVKTGAGSSSVSSDLAAAGLIEDAAAFDAFLCNNGYSKKIRTGTYEILPGTSEEDIAKIITQQS